MNIYTKIAVVFANIGAINWGLATFNVNLVTLILGSIPILVTIVYALIGLAGLYCLYRLIVNKR
jgi:uncharacterized membrane protein YuzA (DUF378 family)